MAQVSIEHVEKLLDDRAGFRIRAEWGYVSAVLGGGHICEFVSSSHPEVNPLWRPPWLTIDPYRYKAGEDEERFGPPPDAALLAGIAGHSLSFDHFGPPSAEETASGLSTHGEAPSALWKIHREFDGEQAGLEYGAVLPISQIDFKRTLRVDPKRPVIYYEEKARNLSASDRAISWNEHVTVGPPFLNCNDTLVDMPATRAKAIDASYSDEMLIMPDACFEWPNASTQTGGVHNLRETPDGRYCRYTAQLLDPALEIGFIAIGSPSKGLALVYIFRRADFPWVGNWEERFYHENPPWTGKTFCRGIEFSSTPFAIPKRETISRGPLFENATYRWLPARSEIAVRFVALLLEIPPDFRGVERTSLTGSAVRIHEYGTERLITQPVKTSFLVGASTEQ
jgi:hypothetical protein